MMNPEIEIEDLPVAYYISTNVKEAYTFSSREEAEAVAKTLGLDFKVLEVADDTDTKN